MKRPRMYIPQEAMGMIDLEIPMVPNFIIKSEDRKYAISEFTERQLRAIGQAWTERLIERAAEQRKALAS